jgi:hypothetical protein
MHEDHLHSEGCAEIVADLYTEYIHTCAIAGAHGDPHVCDCGNSWSRTTLDTEEG